jgi:hypothetical protein
MPKVYLVNEPRVNNRGEILDYSKAETYGEVVIIFDANKWPKPSKDASAALKHASDVLDDLTEDDYILYCGGDAIALAIVAMIADKFLEGRTKFLRWDRYKDSDDGQYRVIKVDNE